MAAQKAIIMNKRPPVLSAAHVSSQTAQRQIGDVGQTVGCGNTNEEQEQDKREAMCIQVVRGDAVYIRIEINMIIQVDIS